MEDSTGQARGVIMFSKKQLNLLAPKSDHNGKPDQARLCRYSYLMQDQAWETFHVTDEQKGPHCLAGRERARGGLVGGGCKLSRTRKLPIGKRMHRRLCGVGARGV